jgi:hypothetical protein
MGKRINGGKNSMDFLRFQLGKTEKLALAFPQGIRKEGIYGPQMFYTLVDGRGMYLDEAVAQKIVNANIQPGQVFWMVKHKASGNGRNRRNIWDLYLEDPTPKESESKLERDLRLSIHQVEKKRTPPPVTPITPPASGEFPHVEQPMATGPTIQSCAVVSNAEISRKPPAWAETLLSQTNELVDAYAQCLNHANQHGVILRPDDVRTLLVTSFISLSQRGKGRNVA